MVFTSPLPVHPASMSAATAARTGVPVRATVPVTMTAA
jgi:hypothetical protein